MGIVWILGAGFSKPLGGPLLGKLLSPEAERDLAVRYNRAPLWGPYPEAARLLYQYGRAGKGGTVRTPRGDVFDREDLWEDAEQYLDYLDTAAEGGGPGRDRLVQILGRLNPALGYKDVKPIAAAGRRLLAAECCAFLEGASPESERWRPYRRWLEHVATGEDVMITFNYDTAVETVAEATKRQLRYTTKGSRPSHTVKLLKLHGSVNWKLSSDGTSYKVNEQGSRREALDCEDWELAIAGPGPSKQSFSGGAFKPYWDEAIEAIRMASAVVFVGYRFPPTDAEARERLLAAIHDNEQQYLAIHIVLGPDTGTPDSKRLVGLLQHAVVGQRRVAGAGEDVEMTGGVRMYSIQPQPLWTEDFFSVVDRKSILRPN